MPHDGLHILIGHRVEDARATAGFHQLDGHVGRSGYGHRFAPVYQYFGQAFAIEGRIEATAGRHDRGRVRAALHEIADECRLRVDDGEHQWRQAERALRRAHVRAALDQEPGQLLVVVRYGIPERRHPVFPGIHARFEFSPRQILRAAWTNTLARPNYYALVPYRIINQADNEIELGNPDLDPTKSMNFDLMYEQYFSSVGILSAGVFYKDIQSFVTLVTPIGVLPSSPFGPPRHLHGNPELHASDRPAGTGVETDEKAEAGPVL